MWLSRAADQELVLRLPHETSMHMDNGDDIIYRYLCLTRQVLLLHGLELRYAEINLRFLGNRLHVVLEYLAFKARKSHVCLWNIDLKVRRSPRHPTIHYFATIVRTYNMLL